jgi:hypothetical protein
MSCESLFRPAGVSSPFFRATLLTPARFRSAHRAFAAAESFALVAADILFPPALNAERDKGVLKKRSETFFQSTDLPANRKCFLQRSEGCVHVLWIRFSSSSATLFAFPHDAVIRVYDAAGNVIETHEHTGDFREW